MHFSISKLQSYRKSEDGNVAPFLALAAIPLLALSSMAVDSIRMKSERAHLVAALDKAVLSAVTHQNLTEGERQEYAEKVFWDNLGDHNLDIDLKVSDAADARVSLEVTADLMTFGILDDDGKVSFSEKATAKLTFGEVVCMLALAPKGERAFEITGGARLNAPSCSIQVNSDDERAAIIDHGGAALAQNFCISGGAEGKFEPSVNTKCGTISDPFSDKEFERQQPCMDTQTLTSDLESWQAESTGITLEPGTYCGGLNLVQKNITFAPGVYVMKDGPLILDRGTRVYADGVTFILQGETAVFRANEGSKAFIKAPSTGDFAGLAFFQDTHPDAKNFKPLPSGETVIEYGADITLIGVVYLPEQKLAFRGASLLENQAPATSFIGYQISVGDGSIVELAVDHLAAGLPPIKPRRDASAQLSK